MRSVLARLVAYALLAAAGGCASSSVVTCPDGTTCPQGAACVAAAGRAGSADTTLHFCVDSELLTPCDGKPDLAACSKDPMQPAGTCHGGACFENTCGDGLKDTNEVCDDGNLASADGCSQDCRSEETCGNHIVDLALGEECDDNNQTNFDGCSEQCKIEVPRWERLRQPTPVDSTEIAFDPNRGRVVGFGGFTYSTGVGVMIDETLEWDGHRLELSYPSIAPPPEDGVGLAFDGTALVSYGGYSASASTYTYDATGWHPIDSAGGPPKMSFATAVYDSRRRRALVMASGGTTSSDVWAWHAGTWTKVTITGTAPQPRSTPGLAYDPKRDVLVLAGGSGNTDVWELAFDAAGNGTWSQKTATSTLPAGAVVAAFEPVLGRVLLLGTGSGTTASAYYWDGGSLTPAPAPTGRLDDYRITTDTNRGRIVLFGVDESSATNYVNSVMELDVGTSTWVTLVKRGASPASREHAGSATDRRRHQIVRFGGEPPGGGPTFADTWVWDGTWRQITTSPPARKFQSMVYDALHDEVVMFGGIVSGVASSETWVFRHTFATDPGHWVQLSPSSVPPPRWSAQMAWDAARQKVVMFGGNSGNFSYLGDTWEWDGSNWSKPPSTTSPSAVTPPMTGHTAMAYDYAHAQTIMFDGRSGTTWRWDGAWTNLSPASSPEAEVGGRMAWDAPLGRLVLLVAYHVWTWDGTTWSRLDVQSPPNWYYDDEVLEDPQGRGIVMLGNPPDTSASGEFLRLRYVPPLHDAFETCTANDVDGDLRAGCADPDCWSVCTPLCPPGATGCPTAPKCGDGMCDAYLESCALCPADCGACPPRCGNLVCDSGETATSCPGDCP